MITLFGQHESSHPSRNSSLSKRKRRKQCYTKIKENHVSNKSHDMINDSLCSMKS